MGSPEQRLADMGITLKSRIGPGQGPVPVVQDGNLLYLSGHGPQDDNGDLLYVGRLGAELTLEDGYAAARATGVQLLRSIKGHLGTLDSVDRIVKVLAFVNSDDDFHEQSLVVHGFSDLMVQVFGERGRHARSAIGTSNLPNNQPIEIEMIVRVR
jgi:enamine deaminase RidA (YjgF/YER057c/UK114 family)